MNLGILTSGLVFAAVFLRLVLARWRFGLNAVVAFWLASDIQLSAQPRDGTRLDAEGTAVPTTTRI